MSIRSLINVATAVTSQTINLVGDVAQAASVHSNEWAQRSRIETVESRKGWASELLATTQERVNRAHTDLVKLGLTNEQITEQTQSILDQFDMK